MVFEEFLSHFNNTLSNQNVFYNKTFSKSTERVMKVLIVVFIVTTLFNLIWLLKGGDYFIGLFPVGLVSLIIALYVFVFLKIKSRKELDSNEIKKPKNFFKWDSEEMKSFRIRKGFVEYEKVSSDVIYAYIGSAERGIAEPIKNPLHPFAKYGHYSIRTVLAIFIGLLVYDLKENFTSSYFKEIMSLIAAFILLYGALLFVWQFMFLNLLLDKQRNKKERLKDFVDVMSNIITLRKQKRQKDKTKR